MAIEATDLFDTDEVAALLGVPAEKVRSARHRVKAGIGGLDLLGDLPGPIRYIGRNPVYDAKAITRAVAERNKARAKAQREAEKAAAKAAREAARASAQG